MSRRSFAPAFCAAVIVAVSGLAHACRTTTPAMLDPAMASCVPASATALAGFNLDRLRAGALYAKLPRVVLDAVERLEVGSRASYALFVSDGADVLAIARGPFRQAPPGATLLAGGIAIAGPPELVRAAVAQHRAGTPGAPQLLTPARSLAAAHPIWIVVRGGAMIGLHGNAANLNRLLRATEYTTIAIDLRDAGGGLVAVEMAGICRGEDAGRELEQSLRAILSLAAAANARQPDVAALVRAIEIRRDGSTVRATLSASPDSLDRILGGF